MQTKAKWSDWRETLTAEDLKAIMTKRRIQIDCYYKNNERRCVWWYPGEGILKVIVNGSTKEFKDNEVNEVIKFYRKGLPTPN